MFCNCACNRINDFGNLDLAIGNIGILDQLASGQFGIFIGSLDGILVNLNLNLRAVSLQNLNFQSVKAAGQSTAIVALNNSIVLSALRGLLSSVNNTADGVQNVGLADLILERGFKVRINSGGSQRSDIVGSAVNAYLVGALKLVSLPST